MDAENAKVISANIGIGFHMIEPFYGVSKFICHLEHLKMLIAYLSLDQMLMPLSQRMYHT